MKYFTIYSKRIREHLLQNGFEEVKEPEHNFKFPQFLVFFFEDTEELRNELRKMGVNNV